MKDSVTVKWGKENITIVPLSFKQLRETLPKFAALTEIMKADGYNNPNAFDLSMDIVDAGCSSHSRDELEGSPVTLAQLQDAMNAVAELSGLVESAEQEGGEDAEGKTVSTGQESTPG